MKKLLLSVFSLLILHHSACFSLDKGEDKVDIKIAAALAAQVEEELKNTLSEQLENQPDIRIFPLNENNTTPKATCYTPHRAVYYTASFQQLEALPLAQYTDKATVRNALKMFARKHLATYNTQVDSAHFTFVNKNNDKIFVPIELEQLIKQPH